MAPIVPWSSAMLVLKRLHNTRKQDCLCLWLGEDEAGVIKNQWLIMYVSCFLFQYRLVVLRGREPIVEAKAMSDHEVVAMDVDEEVKAGDGEASLKKEASPKKEKEASPKKEKEGTKEEVREKGELVSRVESPDDYD